MNAPTIRWSLDLVRRAQRVLGRHRVFGDALAELSAEFGQPVTTDSLHNAFKRNGLNAPTHYLARPIPDIASRDTERMLPADPHELPDDSGTTGPVSQPRVEIVDDSPVSADAERFAPLIDFVRKHSKKGGAELEALCDALGKPPREVRKLIDDAQARGFFVEVAHDRLHLKTPEPPAALRPVAVDAAGLGKSHRIAVFSDLHYGSKYCLREQHAAFVQSTYDDGIRDFFCPGDVLEGCYRHAQWELSATSWEDQANEFLDSLPHLPGMRVFFIDGNHDGTWTDRTGVESGRNLVRLAADRGRHDLHFLGSRGALIQYGDTRIELWHPKKGAAYALSYQLQNKIRDTAPERLPHILLTGHTHQYVKFRRSNVWGLYAATFQHGDAPYGRSLGGDVTMGGIVLEWTQDDDGQVRRLSDTLHLAHHQVKTFDVAV